MADTPVVPANKVQGDPLLATEWNSAAHIANIMNGLSSGNGLEIIKSAAGISMAQTFNEKIGLPGWTMTGINLQPTEEGNPEGEIQPMQVIEVIGVPVSVTDDNGLFQNYRALNIRTITEETIAESDGKGGLWRGRAIAIDRIPGNGGTGRIYVGGLCLTTIIVPPVEPDETSLSSYDEEDIIWVGPARYATIDSQNDIDDNLKFLTISSYGEFEVLWVDNTKEERRFAVVRFPGVPAFKVYRTTTGKETINGLEIIKVKEVISDGTTADEDLEIEMIVLP